jgi:cobalt-zinc-cadmium efflux system outer membrane protein
MGLASFATTASVASAQSTLTYQQALAMARDRAPRVAVARARIDEARGRLIGAQIRSRDNPVLDISAGPRRLETGTVTDFEFGLSQVFELGQRRAARVDAAQAGVLRETAISDASLRQVVRDVAVAFVRALAAQSRLEALRLDEGLARDALEVAERRYRAGDVAILSVNLARGALARATSHIRAAEADRQGAAGELKALLAWTEAAEPTFVGDFREFIQEASRAQSVAPAQRPEAQMLAAEVAEGQATVRLGGALTKPDLGVGFRMKREEAHRAAEGAVSIVLPLFSKGQEQAAVGTAQVRRAELERQSVLTEIDVRAQSALAVFRLRVAATEPLERDVLPGLEENERLARRSFEVGELSLPDLLVIRREFVETRLQYLDRLADAAVASVDWQAAAGVLK